MRLLDHPTADSVDSVTPLVRHLLLPLVLVVAASAQTELRLGEPTLVRLPAVDAAERIFSFEQGFRVTVPRTASRLIVRFEDFDVNLFTPYNLIVRPRFDVTVADPNYSALQSTSTDHTRTIIFPLDYRRDEQVYNIGFQVARRLVPLTGILTASLEAIGEGARIDVPSTAQIMLAGEPSGSNFRGFTLPANACPSTAVRAGQAYRVDADGGLTYQVSGNMTEFFGPGGRSTKVDLAGSFEQTRLTGVFGPRSSLVGVFRGAQANLSQVPLRFEGEVPDTPVVRPDRHTGITDVPVLRPTLDQIFYIGTGLTSTRQPKTFVAPPGATQLFLGVLEGRSPEPYTGSIRAFVRESVVPATPASGDTVVPGISMVHLAAAEPRGRYTLTGFQSFGEEFHRAAEVNASFREGDVLEFAARGVTVPLGLAGPNGDDVTVNIESAFAAVIGNIQTRRGALLGVFTGETLDLNLRPAAASVTAVPTSALIEPRLQQPFFIGSGRNFGGVPRQYRVPVGARRLWLGVAQAGSRDVVGSYRVTVGVRSATGPSIRSIVNGAGFQFGASAGQIVSLFGENFVPLQVAETVPLPRELNGLEVWFDEFRAPLYFVSPGQVNAQVPVELGPRDFTTVTVRRSGVISPPFVLGLRPLTGGVFTLPDGRPVAVNVRTNQLATAAAPPLPGDTLTIYSSGQGPVLPRTASGQPAPGDRLSPTIYPIRVRFLQGASSVEGRVLFSGLAPGFIGVYQINVTIPADAPVGELRLRVDSPDREDFTDFPFTIRAAP